MGNEKMEKRISTLMNELNRRRLNFHSILITKDGNTLYEEYRKPFGPDQPHRMYSVTKSFVSMAIGCLADEGKIDLDDQIIKYFPDKQPTEISREMSEQTIRHMLMMSTSISGFNWFLPEVKDRVKFYFAQKPVKPSGTLFDYDSTGSYVLGVLVERLSGMKLLDYMKHKFLNAIGGFENAQLLETPDGTAWGDSALLCTTRALERFARFVMQDGKWEGKQLISPDYVQKAKSCQTTNCLDGTNLCNNYGYGYQIWMTERGFAFDGMGGQHALCMPEENLIFVCTGDNQYNYEYMEILYDAVFRYLMPLEKEYPSPSELMVQQGAYSSLFADRINGKWYICKDNEMGLKKFRFVFTGNEGTLEYVNAQGEKKLHFGFGYNVFEKFPQRGYSDGRGNVHDESSQFLLDCAVSGAWIEEQKLFLRVQIVDRYFGSTMMTFGFRDETTVGVRMVKCAEDFLNEYNGRAIAYCETKLF